MNAHCVRFNRSIHEDFAASMTICFFADLELFNGKLLEWLSWYNIENPHHSLARQFPIQVKQAILQR